ncbi:gluconeogenesis factor YvcK family protein, partial [Paenibacillus zanthoxyli]|uniref:gluconeogenesis factor YvcK family protein n=1 Tax=Paenibacillus zanthoxyli TaxID=369399 RepID=UPI0004703844
VEPLMADIMRYRFSSGEGLAGHSLGNLILAALTDISGDFVTAVRELSRVFAVRGRVLPAAGEAVVLNAEMTDGRIVTGESKIPEAGGRIKRVYLEPPDVEPLPEALKAIRSADAILLGPGSLYTSILPNLLVPKLAQAVVASSAVKMFICNVMTQPGETDGYTVSDHLQAVYDHIGMHLFDYVIVNNGEVPPEVQRKYAEQGARPVELDMKAIEDQRYKLIADKLVLFRTYLRHDTDKLSHHIYQLVQDWITRKR